MGSAKRYGVVVEFDSDGEAQDFIDEVEEYGLIASRVHRHAYRPLKAFAATEATSATNTITGPVTGTAVQCQNIDGGLHL